MFKKCKVQIGVTAHAQQRAAERGISRFELDAARVAAQQAGFRGGLFKKGNVVISVKGCEHDARQLVVSTTWRV